MTRLLLRTKFFLPPTSLNHVKRPRLVAKLSQSLHVPLTILSAPAGCGKTTLISEWKESLPDPARLAWLSLDPGDNDLNRFLLYLCGALEEINPGLVLNTGVLLQEVQAPPLRAVWTALINDLAGEEHELLLVLDNYHLLADRDIHHTVAFLVDHLPQQIHLILLSRADPPLPLASLRAGGKLVEIRSAELSFSPAEAEIFLNQEMRLGLSPESIRALSVRTEGWIAGLKLAALSLADQTDKAQFIADFSGSNRYVLDYLMEEILKQQTADRRQFLIKTSLLDKFTASLCNALLGIKNGRDIIQELYQSNSFIIPLDSGGRWFRYHRLFSDLLQYQFNKDYSAEERWELNRLAGDWYDKNGLAMEAIHHALICLDYSWAIQLLKKHLQVWQLSEHRHCALEWFAGFPAEVLRRDPWLSLQYAKLLLGQKEIETTLKYLDFAQGALERAIRVNEELASDPDHLELQADLHSIKAMLALQEGRPRLALDSANQALATAPEAAASVKAAAYNVLQLVHRDRGEIEKALEACRLGLPESLSSGQVGLIVSAYNIYGGLLLIQGQLREAARIYREALSREEELPERGIVGFSIIRLRLADIYYQWNRIDEAAELIWQAIDRVDLGDDLFGMIYGRYLLMLIFSARGERSRLEQVWWEIKQILPRTREVYYAGELQRLLELTKIRLGLKDEADVEISPPDLGLPDELPSRELEIRLLEARFAVELNHLDSLGDYLAGLENAAAQRGHIYWLIQIHIQQALLNLREGNRDRAASYLLKSLRLGEAQRFMRVFLDEGEPIRDLLRHARPQLQEPGLVEYANKLAASLQSGRSEGMPAKQPLIEPLSERELEVLGLISEGDSNQEIAEKLVISVGTVKRHTVNIYSKLDVKNRTEAVAKARDLDLL